MRVTLWERPIASPSRSEDDWDDVVDVYGFGGINSGQAYELTEDEERELRKERRRALQRKKPCGFAPWPETRR